MIVNAHFSIRPIKGLNWELRSPENTKVNCSQVPIKGRRPRILIMRASDGDDVVETNVPESPPVRPKPVAPAGTPVVQPLSLSRRLRRYRKSTTMRETFQETNLSAAKFVYPLFIHKGEKNTPIRDMPGCYILGWRNGLLEEVSKAQDVGVNSIVLLPKVADGLKCPTGDEAYNENGLVPRTIRMLKDKYPDIAIYTDVALNPYSFDGHDAIVRQGVVVNEETVHRLCKQAVAQARAGADVVSSDGHIGAIRAALDGDGLQDVLIMSYSVNYQLNPANHKDALRQACEDESQGADILLVTPGVSSRIMPRVHIVRLLRDNSVLPIATYQDVKEYSMIRDGGIFEVLDEEATMMETLVCRGRAGARIIITHFALQVARCLCGEKR